MKEYPSPHNKTCHGGACHAILKPMAEQYDETGRTLASDYFFNGFVELSLQGPFGGLVKQAARDVFYNQLKPDERLEQKYAGSADLRPASSLRFQEISDAFAHWDGKKQVEDILQRPVSLNILQIRRALAGQSYMSTHRDTYQIGNKIVGNAPAIAKLIHYYSESGEPQLHFYTGSQHRYFQSRHIDRFYNQVFSPKVDLTAKPDSLYLFNTFCVHAVPHLAQDAVRVIFSLKYEY